MSKTHRTYKKRIKREVRERGNKLSLIRQYEDEQAKRGHLEVSIGYGNDARIDY